MGIIRNIVLIHVSISIHVSKHSVEWYTLTNDLQQRNDRTWREHSVRLCYGAIWTPVEAYWVYLDPLVMLLSTIWGKSWCYSLQFGATRHATPNNLGPIVMLLSAIWGYSSCYSPLLGATRHATPCNLSPLVMLLPKICVLYYNVDEIYFFVICGNKLVQTYFKLVWTEGEFRRSQSNANLTNFNAIHQLRLVGIALRLCKTRQRLHGWRVVTDNKHRSPPF